MQRDVSSLKRRARFARNQDGATAIEYGLMSALAGLVIIPVASSLGQKIDQNLNAIDTALSPAGITITVSPDEAGCAALKAFGLSSHDLCGPPDMLKSERPEREPQGLRLTRHKE